MKIEVAIQGQDFESFSVFFQIRRKYRIFSVNMQVILRRVLGTSERHYRETHRNNGTSMSTPFVTQILIHSVCHNQSHTL